MLHHPTCFCMSSVGYCRRIPLQISFLFRLYPARCYNHVPVGERDRLNKRIRTSVVFLQQFGNRVVRVNNDDLSRLGVSLRKVEFQNERPTEACARNLKEEELQKGGIRWETCCAAPVGGIAQEGIETAASLQGPYLDTTQDTRGCKSTSQSNTFFRGETTRQ